VNVVTRILELSPLIKRCHEKCNTELSNCTWYNAKIDVTKLETIALV
jgi:hypothetical protein